MHPLQQALFVLDDGLNEKGWRAVLGAHLQIEKVEGTHVSMIQQPHVRTLGRVMSRTLKRAESVSAGSAQVGQGRLSRDPSG